MLTYLLSGVEEFDDLKNSIKRKGSIHNSCCITTCWIELSTQPHLVWQQEQQYFPEQLQTGYWARLQHM